MRASEQAIARLARWFEADAHLTERDAVEALAVCERAPRPRQSELQLTNAPRATDERQH